VAALRRAIYTGSVTFLVFFYSSTKLQPITVNQCFAHNSSIDVVWCKEDPFGDDKCVIHHNAALSTLL